MVGKTQKVPLGIRILQAIAGPKFSITRVTPSRTGSSLSTEFEKMSRVAHGISYYKEYARSHDMTDHERFVLATLTFQQLKLIKSSELLQTAIGNDVVEACFQGFVTCFPVSYLGMTDKEEDIIRKKAEPGKPALERMQNTIDDYYKPLIQRACDSKQYVHEGDTLVIPMVHVNPKDGKEEVDGVIGLRKVSGQPVSSEDKEVAGLFSIAAGNAIGEAKVMDDYFRIQLELRKDAKLDVLNYKAVMEELDRLISRAKRYGEEVSVIMIDIDHFKNLNDTLGHPFGDECLKALVEVLKGTVRASDFVGRYGGEEFFIALPKTGKREAMKLAEKLRETVKEMLVNAGGQEAKITISAGVSTFAEDAASLVDLLKSVDVNLYLAKNGGRNMTMTTLSDGTKASAAAAENWYAAQEALKKQEKELRESATVIDDQLKGKK